MGTCTVPQEERSSVRRWLCAENRQEVQQARGTSSRLVKAAHKGAPRPSPAVQGVHDVTNAYYFQYVVLLGYTAVHADLVRCIICCAHDCRVMEAVHTSIY